VAVQIPSKPDEGEIDDHTDNKDDDEQKPEVLPDTTDKKDDDTDKKDDDTADVKDPDAIPQPSGPATAWWTYNESDWTSEGSA